MLEILYYSGSEEEAQALASFDPLEHLLVCAGVRTKRMLQEAKLTEKGWLPGNSILRAREFWQSIYRDVAPAESPMDISSLSGVGAGAPSLLRKDVVPAFLQTAESVG